VAGVNVPSFGQRTVTTRLRLRDGESNLLAGLLREDERRALTGFPGAINVPILRQLFSANDNTINQTDIIMLLTPHIIRTSEITEADLRPIHIGSQQNLGIGGPPPLIAASPELGAPNAAAAPLANSPAPPVGAPGATIPPPGSTPVPGTVAPSPQPVAPPSQGAPPITVAPAPPPQGSPADQVPPSTSSGVGAAQVLISPPGTTFRVGGGPYTVPISIANASRISTITLTLTFDPALLRVRSVQEGSFMRTGGANATFAQQVAPGRVDVTITRSADATGASGTGLLAAILFDPVGPGSGQVVASGTATGPANIAMGLQFQPVTVTIEQ
jgi:general secretion pathway protein D